MQQALGPFLQHIALQVYLRQAVHWLRLKANKFKANCCIGTNYKPARSSTLLHTKQGSTMDAMWWKHHKTSCILQLMSETLTCVLHQ